MKQQPRISFGQGVFGPNFLDATQKRDRTHFQEPYSIYSDCQFQSFRGSRKIWGPKNLQNVKHQDLENTWRFTFNTCVSLAFSEIFRKFAGKNIHYSTKDVVEFCKLN